MMNQGSFAFKVIWVLLLIVTVSAVDARVGESHRRLGVPEDWTHHHIVFPLAYLRSHPEVMSREPRALHQIYRRLRAGVNLSQTSAVGSAKTQSSGGDWNVNVGATMAPGTSPAKYQTDPTAPPSCTADYVIFGLNAKGTTGGQATLVGFNNLYAGPNGVGGQCPGGPTYLFAYNTTTQTNGRVRTSPVLSLDGTKIAFIESSASGSAVHVLKWGTTGNNGFSGSTGSAFPGTGNNAVMTTIAYTTANNNHSSPWVDYPSDTMYVAADDGKLYKITGVFKGTPTLVTTGGWPITIKGVGQMTSAVYDSTTGNVFIGDSTGILYSASTTSPGTITKFAVGTTGFLNPAITDGPIVSADGFVFATSSDDGTSAVIVQANTSNLAQQARIRIGAGSTTGTSVTLYDGDFDNAYYNNQNTGHMVLCGTSSTTTAPYRYRLSISGGILQTDTAPVQITNSTTARCGPLTEYFNPNIGSLGTDYFFWGVTDTCVGTTGCVMSLANALTVNTAAEPGGTSAVIIDNDSNTAGQQTSNIYFANLTGPQRVNKVQQSTLQ